jgi:1-acyl-sn-glycerol-3-phosphate acyltransferase
VADLDPHAGDTVELALRDLDRHLPEAADALREALPGLEPDRQITDWGRSERIERLVDRTLYGFLYHYWFRVEVEGVEHVPPDGGALLVANHGGAIPPDGAMIAKAIAQEHPRPRPVTLIAHNTFAGVPGLGMLVTKLGGVPAHPANVHRLLFDERQLVLAFPEVAGKVLSERNLLRPFEPGGPIELALRAEVPIVPVATLGAEEAMPVFGRLRRLPITSALPLPAKFRIRFLEPVLPSELGHTPWEERELVQTLTEDIRALIQENLLELVAQRRSVWLG